ncbi:allophanate hydrolase [Allohahella marinimesophila]
MDISPQRLRAAYRSGGRKPSEVIEHLLSRFVDEDQQGVWISTVAVDRLRASAREMDTRLNELDEFPLLGLPFSVKDCIDVAGEVTTAACPEFSYLAEHSSPVVQRAIDCGAIYIGKTNMDQFATGLVGTRSPYGTARNPYNPLYIPGGSSSGSAVSVATGTSSFSLGTDTGGSGRVPASYCGVTGLKPAPGALSRRGMVSACRSFDTISLYTASADDGLEVFRHLLAYDPADCWSDDAYALQEVGAEATSMRIATPRSEDLCFFGDTETPDLFMRGQTVAESHFGPLAKIDFSAFTEVNDLMFFGPFVAERDVSVGTFLDSNPGAGIDVVRSLIVGSRTHTAADAYRAYYRLKEARHALKAFWQQYDVLMVPTVGSVLSLDDVASEPLQTSFNNGYYTNFANPLQLAAVAVPSQVTSSGVPFGVTFLGPAGTEAKLANVASQFVAACTMASSTAQRQSA